MKIQQQDQSDKYFDIASDIIQNNQAVYHTLETKQARDNIQPLCALTFDDILKRELLRAQGYDPNTVRTES